MVDASEYDRDYDKLYGSRYLGDADLEGGEPRLKISKVEIAELRDKGGATKLKFVVSFEGVEKGLVVNKTNAKKLADAYGKRREQWIGQLVQLYSEDTSFGKGVRVRPLRKPAIVNQPDPDDLADAVPGF
jgi:hypothetical protein